MNKLLAIVEDKNSAWQGLLLVVAIVWIVGVGLLAIAVIYYAPLWFGIPVGVGIFALDIFGVGYTLGLLTE